MRTLKPIHANRGAAVKYRKQLDVLIQDMSDSYLYWLTATYRANPPIEIATDALPSSDAKKRLNELAKRWMKRFDEMALHIATLHVNSLTGITDKAMMNALKEAGWTVNFQITRAMRDVMGASIAENVSLIKSIPQQYHTKLEGIVMRNYSVGKDLFTMRKEIQATYPVTLRRAVLITNDQTSKLNIAVQNARHLELGITQAKWMHSHAGKEPRPDHVAANGKIYDIAKGCLISGEYIHPGYLINCRCVSGAVLPF